MRRRPEICEFSREGQCVRSAKCDSAGLTNLVSLYATFDPIDRYNDTYRINDHVFLLEDGQNRMGAPFWRDLDRYRRNGPIIYVERVMTR